MKSLKKLLRQAIALVRPDTVSGALAGMNKAMAHFERIRQERQDAVREHSNQILDLQKARDAHDAEARKALRAIERFNGLAGDLL